MDWIHIILDSSRFRPRPWQVHRLKSWKFDLGSLVASARRSHTAGTLIFCGTRKSHAECVTIRIIEYTWPIPVLEFQLLYSHDLWKVNVTQQHTAIDLDPTHKILRELKCVSMFFLVLLIIRQPSPCCRPLAKVQSLFRWKCHQSMYSSVAPVVNGILILLLKV